MAEEKEFVFEEWLAQGIGGLVPCLPEQFRQHMRAARRERLLAVRSLLDAALERAEERPKKKTAKIKVE